MLAPTLVRLLSVLVGAVLGSVACGQLLVDRTGTWRASNSSGAVRWLFIRTKRDNNKHDDENNHDEPRLLCGDHSRRWHKRRATAAERNSLNTNNASRPPPPAFRGGGHRKALAPASQSLRQLRWLRTRPPRHLTHVTVVDRCLAAASKTSNVYDEKTTLAGFSREFPSFDRPSRDDCAQGGEGRRRCAPPRPARHTTPLPPVGETRAVALQTRRAPTISARVGECQRLRAPSKQIACR
jgi:hypothetical protein